MSALKRKEAREVVVGLLFETEFKNDENSKNATKTRFIF